MFRAKDRFFETSSEFLLREARSVTSRTESRMSGPAPASTASRKQRARRSVERTNERTPEPTNTNDHASTPAECEPAALAAAPARTSGASEHPPTRTKEERGKRRERAVRPHGLDRPACLPAPVTMKSRQQRAGSIGLTVDSPPCAAAAAAAAAACPRLWAAGGLSPRSL